MKLKNTGKKAVYTETGRIQPGEVYTCDKAEATVLLTNPSMSEVKPVKKKKKK